MTSLSHAHIPAARPRTLPLLAAVALLLAALWGCHSAPDARLVAAEALMETRPDSALAILDSLAPATLTAPDRALHALLLTQARDKNYITETNDSLISAAVDYFDSHGPDSCLMKALFYRANILYNNADYPASIKAGNRAYELAVQRNDAYWQGRLSEQLAQNFDYTGNYPQALLFRKSAVKAYGESRRARFRNFALCNLAIGYANMQHYDSAKCLFDSVAQLWQSAGAAPDTALQRLSLSAQIPFLVYNEKYSEALDKAGQWQNLGSYFTPSIEDIAFITLARIGVADTVGAKEQLDALLSYRPSPAEKIVVFRALQQYCRAGRDYEQASVYADSILALKYAMVEDALRDSGMKASAEYAAEVAEAERQRALSAKTAATAIAIGCAVVVLLIVAMYYMRVRMVRAESMARIGEILYVNAQLLCRQEEQQNKINTLSSDIENRRALQAELNTTIATLFKDKWEVLMAVCDEFLGNADLSESARKVLMNKVESQLKSIFNDSVRTEIIDRVNEWQSDILVKIKADCPDLTDDDILIYAMIVAGFSARSISFLFGLKLRSFFMRRIRIREKIERSGCKSADYYISFINPKKV